MSSVRAHLPRIRTDVVAPVGLAAVTGALIAQQPLTIMAVIVVAAVAIGQALPVAVFIGVVLAIRNFTDPLAASSLGGGLNASALLGVWVVAVLVARISLGRARLPPPPIVVFGVLCCAWSLVGFSRFGLDQSLVRETVRIISILAMGVLALGYAKDSPRPIRLLRIVVLAGILPAAVAIGTGGGFGEEATTRASSTFSHPNAAADLFATDVTVSVALLMHDPRIKWLWGCVALFALALIASGSLGGIAHALVGTLILLVLSEAKFGRKAAAVVGTAFFAVLFAVSPLGSGRLSELQGTVSYSDATTGAVSNSFDWRFFNWSRLLELWHEHEWFGWGTGSTSKLLTPLGVPPHSDYVRLLVETGVVGSAIFVGLGATLMVKLWRRRVTRDPGQLTAVNCGLALSAGIAVNALVATPTLRVTTMFALVVIFVAAFANYNTAVQTEKSDL